MNSFIYQEINSLPFFFKSEFRNNLRDEVLYGFIRVEDRFILITWVSEQVSGVRRGKKKRKEKYTLSGVITHIFIYKTKQEHWCIVDQ